MSSQILSVFVILICLLNIGGQLYLAINHNNQRKKIKCPTIDDVFSFLKLVWLWPLCDILVPCFIHFPVYRMEFPHSVCSKHEHKVSLLYILLFDKTMYGEFKSFTYFLSDGYLFEVSDIFIRIQRVLIYYLLLYLNRKI